ncbi:MAG: hypothetical protein ITG02_12990 [Patulibacter sp.]|nr:hypothetical protein [Patulibacter sp.]
MPASLLDRRLLVVTGKGGVGKTTVATALGALAARRGKRVVVAEVGRAADVPAALREHPTAANVGAPPARDDGFSERLLVQEPTGSLWHASISPEAALREYLRDQLPLGPLAELLRSDRLFAGLTAATPGLRELLAMGKLWELAQPTRRTPDAEPYDLCIVDAPASGHAITLLRAPGQFAATARVGPVARQGTTIAAAIADDAFAAAVIVSAPTQLAVTEALALAPQLVDAGGLTTRLGVVNGITPQRFSDDDRDRLAAFAAVGSAALRPPASDAVEIALAEADRAAHEQAHADRLARSLDAPVASLSRIPGRGVGRAGIEALVDELDAALPASGSPA